MFRALPLLLLLLAVVPTAQPANAESCPTICRIILRGRLSEMRWPDFADFRSRLFAFYAPGYGYAWLKNNNPTAQAMALIALLKAADRKGLQAEDYDASRWDERIAHLDRAQFDVELTVALLRYLADLHYGKASSGFFHLQTRYHDFDVVNFLRTKLMSASDPNALVAAEAEPPFDDYKRTQKALAECLGKPHETETELSDVTATVEPGMAYDELPELVQRLRQLGDLPGGEEVFPDYQGAVVEAVKHFQQQHGLEPDGRLGPATIDQLNVPSSQRVEQLRLALERWRWVPHSFARPPIVVNIPEFTLRILDKGNEPEMEMKVVVGEAYTNETPVFAADLTHITFRPYWNVPQSILVNEMATRIEGDPTYLASRRYEVVNESEKVVPTQDGLSRAVLQDLLTGRDRIRQLPGPENALGLIRFGIPNENNVYLHATPGQVVFGRARRDFSHGCVRLERPVELAEWCLRGTGHWTPAKIEAAMNGPKTFQVNLKRPVPVLLVYATAVVLRNGEIRFFSDIYHQDALLENRLAQGYPSRMTN